MRSNIWIEIPFDDIDDDDLIDELKNRGLSDDDLKTLCSGGYGTNAKKIELFLDIMDRFSLLELQQIFFKEEEVSACDLSKHPKLFS